MQIRLLGANQRFPFQKYLVIIDYLSYLCYQIRQNLLLHQLPNSADPARGIKITIHSKKKSASEHLFLVLQVVTNRGLYSVPGRTK